MLKNQTRGWNMIIKLHTDEHDQNRHTFKPEEYFNFQSIQ